MDRPLLTFEDIQLPDLRKLKMKVDKDGHRTWFLNDLELPHILADSVKVEWRGRSAFVTLSMEVEVEGLGNPPE